MVNEVAQQVKALLCQPAHLCSTKVVLQPVHTLRHMCSHTHY